MSPWVPTGRCLLNVAWQLGNGGLMEFLLFRILSGIFEIQEIAALDIEGQLYLAVVVYFIIYVTLVLLLLFK